MSEARATFLNILFYFFIYCRLREVFITAYGLCLFVEIGGYPLHEVRGFSLWWRLLLQSKL